MARSLSEVFEPAPSPEPPHPLEAFTALDRRLQELESRTAAPVPRVLPSDTYRTAGFSGPQSPRDSVFSLYGHSASRADHAEAAAAAEVARVQHEQQERERRARQVRARGAHLVDHLRQDLAHAKAVLREAEDALRAPVSVAEAILRPDVLAAGGGAATVVLPTLKPAEGQWDVRPAVVALIGVAAREFGETRVRREQRDAVAAARRRASDIQREIIETDPDPESW